MRKNLCFVAATILVVAVLALPSPAAAGTQTFCISGTSNGTGWSWGIIINGSLTYKGSSGGLTPGQSCAELTKAFAGSIALATSGQDGCYVKVVDDCCFELICEADDVQLWVGGADGDPGSGCPVTGNPDGCEFNPIIFELP